MSNDRIVGGVTTVCATTPDLSQIFEALLRLGVAQMGIVTTTFTLGTSHGKHAAHIAWVYRATLGESHEHIERVVDSLVGFTLRGVENAAVHTVVNDDDAAADTAEELHGH